MLVQIAVTIKHIAVGLHLRVASCTACLLDVVLQRVTNIVMNHKPHILFVYAHPESRGCNDDLYLATHEGVLIGDLLCRLHLAIER